VPRQSYSTMSIDTLAKLRNQISSVWLAVVVHSEKQLETIDGDIGLSERKARRGSPLAGRKVAPRTEGGKEGAMTSRSDPQPH
jgi:hypothetical protein